MITLARRFLVIAALMFWQGGFVFYASIVVPIGTELLGSAKEQGFLTRRVSQQINTAGAIALLPLVWDALATADPSRRRRWTRYLTCGGMLAALLLLMWLHPQLDRLLSPDDDPVHHIYDRPAFRLRHRWYLWIITVQWSLGLLYLAGTLASWRGADRVGQTASRESSSIRAGQGPHFLETDAISTRRR
jgi:hypothetical protein